MAFLVSDLGRMLSLLLQDTKASACSAFAESLGRSLPITSPAWLKSLSTELEVGGMKRT